MAAQEVGVEVFQGFVQEACWKGGSSGVCQLVEGCGKKSATESSRNHWMFDRRTWASWKEGPDMGKRLEE
jgi:hypothetical protein